VDNPTPNAGDNVIFTITLTNNGPWDATGIIVSDVLPTGVTYVSNSASQGSYGSSTGKWTMDSLSNGSSATLTITASVNQGTGGQTISNTASVTADQEDNNSANNSATASFTVQSADLGVANTVDNPTPNVGDNVTYTITVTNSGPWDATGITVSDILPTGVTYVSNSASQGSYDSDTGNWTVGNLSNGSSATLTITASVNPGTGGQTINNTASVTADQEDNNSANNSATASLTVQGAAP
jgi:uncharacterized repeat protein (TIGR01451 family)